MANDHGRARRGHLPAALAGTVLLATAAGTGHARAWGHTGHVEISRLAAQYLPGEVPGFARSAFAVRAVAEFGAEADESKTTGRVTAVAGSGRISTERTVHDAERDPGHYIDVGDDGVVLGGVVPLARLPATRQDFDTAQRNGDETQYSAGYLPYAILDGFGQVRKDFGIWRALQAGLRTARSAGDRAYFRQQIALREQLTLRDIGYWSHFVADASQSMHVSVHYNGWGNYPNPNGYTNAPIHAPFEGAFVRSFVDFRNVARQIGTYRDCACAIEQRVPQYLAQTLRQVEPVYQAAAGDDYQTARPAELAIVTKQLAAGARERRDEIVDAWRQSAAITVGFPLVPVSDILAGKATVTPATFGAD